MLFERHVMAVYLHLDNTVLLLQVLLHLNDALPKALIEFHDGFVHVLLLKLCQMRFLHLFKVLRLLFILLLIHDIRLFNYLFQEILAVLLRMVGQIRLVNVRVHMVDPLLAKRLVVLKVGLNDLLVFIRDLEATIVVFKIVNVSILQKHRTTPAITLPPWGNDHLF
jgi:hypothetical protein